MAGRGSIFFSFAKFPQFVFSGGILDPAGPAGFPALIKRQEFAWRNDAHAPPARYRKMFQISCDQAIRVTGYRHLKERFIAGI